jgi:DNA-binding transcriptional LysR family regulator
MRRVSALPDLSIRQLEYLVAVDEAPSWANAAQQVGVSPSALSQGLAELERRIGVALFERDGRRRRIRADAEPAVAHARLVLGLTHDLSDWSARVRDGRSGRVRVGMIDAAAVGHHTEVLRAFRAERPDVDLRLRVGPSGPLTELLVAGELDLVVCVDPPAPVRGVDVEHLLEEELAVYGPPGVAIGEPVTWGPWVLFPAGSHTRAVVAAALARLGAPLEIAAESHQPEVVREMVHLGTGWTVLPVGQAERGDRPLTGGRRLTTRLLVLATRSNSVRDPAVDQLASLIRSVTSGVGLMRRGLHQPSADPRRGPRGLPIVSIGRAISVEDVRSLDDV